MHVPIMRNPHIKEFRLIRNWFSFLKIFSKELVHYILVIRNIFSWSRWVPYKRILLYIYNNENKYLNKYYDDIMYIYGKYEFTNDKNELPVLGNI